MDGLKKNEIIQLRITGLSSEGSGVGRYNGMAVFVAGAAVAAPYLGYFARSNVDESFAWRILACDYLPL